MDETKQALDRLQRATDSFLAALDAASDTQWRFKPRDGEWSMADTAEHVAKSNELILATLAKQLGPLADTVPQLADDDIPKIFGDATGPAPAGSNPTGRWPDRQELVGLLRSTPDATSRIVAATRGDLRTLGARHPLVGVLDGVQWLLFLAAHTEAHTAQLQEMRRAAGYPPA